MNDLLQAPIAIIVFIIVFMALRNLFLWYWRVDTIVKNQEALLRSQQETNNLLSEQITILKGEFKPTNKEIDL